MSATPGGQTGDTEFKGSVASGGSLSLDFEDIGFGPVSGTLHVSDDSLGIGIPVLDLGVDIDYLAGARLILKAGLGNATVGIDYTTTEGSFIHQSGLMELFPDSQMERDHYQQEGDALYHNRAIQFDTNSIHIQPGQSGLTVTSDPAGNYLTLDLTYDYGLKIDDVTVGVDLYFTSFSDSIDLDLTLLPVTHGVEHIINAHGGDKLGDLSGLGVPELTGFLNVPVYPDYNPLPATQIGTDNAALPTISLEDTGPPFAGVTFDIAKFIARKTGIPLSVAFDSLGLHAELDLLRARVSADASVGQEQSFDPGSVRVQLELFNADGTSTGQVVSGALGDQLNFDAQTIDGYVKATYTLYGALETKTGLVVHAGLDLGLLAGRVDYTGIGPDFHLPFDPLIPLPSPSFTSDLITLVDDSQSITLDPIVRYYPVFAAKDAKGTDGDDNFQVSESQAGVLDLRGGNDVANATDIHKDTIFGSEGNDQIYGSSRQVPFSGDDQPGFIDAPDELHGGTGDDILYGGTGNDRLYGDEGADFLWGDQGNDTLSSFGTDGIDSLYGGPGIDLAVISRSGASQAVSIDFANLPTKGAGVPVLPDGTIVSGIERWDFTAGFGNDSLRAGDGEDTLHGGGGDDTLYSGSHRDVLRGDSGNDTLVYSYTPYSRTSGFFATELHGGQGTDTLTILASGVPGKFVLNFSGNPDLGIAPQYAQPGDAAIYPEQFSYFNYTDTSGTTTTIADVFADIEKLNYSNTSSITKNDIVGGVYADTIDTGGADDRLDGWLGKDLLLAGAGNDTVLSWDADDTLDGGAGTDLLRLIRTPSDKAVVLDISTMGSGDPQTLADGTVVKNFEQLFFNGSDGADLIKGGGLSDTIYGGGGNDHIDGGGAPRFSAAASLGGAAKGDFISAGDGNDVVTAVEMASNAPDTLSGGAGFDTLYLDFAYRNPDVRGGGPSPVGGPIRGLGYPALNINLHDPSAVQSLPNGATFQDFELLALHSGDGDDHIVGGDARGGPVTTQVLDPITHQLSLVTFTTQVGDSIDGGGGNDTIDGGLGQDIVTGGAGDDVVTLHYGEDQQLDGGAGYDVLKVELGGVSVSDLVVVEQDFDYSAPGDDPGSTAPEHETLALFPDGSRAQNFERIDYNGLNLQAALKISLSPFNDAFTGSAFADRINGALGNDTLVGGGGPDTIDGGAGNDVITATDPVHDPLGPIANLFGGEGNDLFDITGPAVLDGGAGVDFATFDFSQFSAGLVADLFDTQAGGSVSNGSTMKGLETFSMTFGSGADKATLGFGANAVDFGAGGDTAIIHRGASSAAQHFAFHAGGLALARAAVAAIAPPDPPVLEGDDGVTLKNFEHLVIVTGDGDDTLDFSGDQGTSDYDVQAGGGADTVIGSLGADTLDGGLGADSLTGGDGDDTYYVDSGGDVVREGEGGGADVVHATASWTATPGSQIEKLVADGSGALYLTGNALPMEIDGNAAVNKLDDGGGQDTLAGGGGSDVYVVHNALTQVLEAPGAGYDAVQTDLSSYSLPANVESLTFIGTGNFSGFGNASANLIAGGAGDDYLDGVANTDGKSDRLVGGKGDDIYVVHSNLDFVVEAVGEGTDTVLTTANSAVAAPNIEALSFIGSGDFTGFANTTGVTLTGGAGNDHLYGGAGADRLVGLGGSDVLTGKGGADVFVLGGGGAGTGGGVDRVTDFHTGEDHTAFGQIVTKVLFATDTFNSATAGGGAGADYLFYDQATGRLYDEGSTFAVANGHAVGGTGTLIATFDAHPSLSAGDFIL